MSHIAIDNAIPVRYNLFLKKSNQYDFFKRGIRE
jgi:hypothetical protein